LISPPDRRGAENPRTSDGSGVLDPAFGFATTSDSAGGVPGVELGEHEVTKIDKSASEVPKAA